MKLTVQGSTPEGVTGLLAVFNATFAGPVVAKVIMQGRPPADGAPK